VSGGITVIDCIRFVLLNDALFCFQPNGAVGQALHQCVTEHLSDAAMDEKYIQNFDGKI
jgi:hypothetical protein